MRRDRPDHSHDCPILHVDMDAFFASVAIRDRPELVDVPVIVGGGHRGVVLAANYPARRYGVHSALPMTRARRMCPDAVVLSPDYTDFDGVSSSVMEIFREVTPLVETVSLDEAFLDVSGATRRLGSPLDMAEHIRARVADEQRITCSVGVAGTVSVAKLASRRAKPDGVLVVPPREVTRFLHPLDVGELYGVGEKTREQLHRLGLRTVGDVAHTPLATLQRGIGAAAGGQLHHLAWGTDRRTLTPRRGTHEPDKSMGADETFGRITTSRSSVSRPNVSSAPMLLSGSWAGRRGVSVRRSVPQARWWIWVPAATPMPRWRVVSEVFATSPTVRSPRRCSCSRVFSPTP